MTNQSSFLPPNRQIEAILRGTVQAHVTQELHDKLRNSHGSNTPLVIKAGFDPTAPDLHLGHAVLLTKLRQLQDFGHQVIFLVGDFTARIGDPTGKNKTRPPLSQQQIEHNCQTYQKQVFRILDSQQTQIRFNSQWLSHLDLNKIITLCAKCSVAQLIERDDFASRLAQRHPVSMHELLYPLMQAYDSVVLKADIELGGSDQLFNLLMGRHLMRQMGLPPQCVLTLPLLEGTDARTQNGQLVGPKMSKSLNNAIGLTDPPNDQFGKLLSINDDLMWRYFTLLSLRDPQQLDQLKQQHPKQAKMQLAHEIVSRFHSQQAANQAQHHFNTLFGPGNRNRIPTNAAVVHLQLPQNTNMPLIQLLH
ncbi:MAG: tyrosine--tRNA ligase, partial [Myxococcota bacterium]